MTISKILRMRFLLAAAAVALALPAGAAGAEAKPALTLTSLPTPTDFVPGDEAGEYNYDLRIANLGAAPTDGSDITVTDTLPAGLTLKSINLPLRSNLNHGIFDYGSFAMPLGICSTQLDGEVETVTCTISESIFEAQQPALIRPGEERRIVLNVKTPAGMGEGKALTNELDVDGGGAPPASVASHNATVTFDAEGHPQPAPGGISFFHSSLMGPDGRPVGQASSHPYQFAFGFAVNTKPPAPGAQAKFVPAGGDIKDIRLKLPAGLIGNPTATERCTAEQFSTTHTRSIGEAGTAFYTTNDCPEGSAVGMILVQQIEGEPGVLPFPLYNLVPPPGMPAQFGAQILNLPFFINTEVRPDDHYRIVGALRNLTQVKRLTAASVVLWGTPADPSHDELRGTCLNEVEALPISNGEKCHAGIAPRPFLRMPTSCASPLDPVLSFDNWTDPGNFLSETDLSPAPSGCSAVGFEPTLQARPTTDVADSPSGLRVDLHIPQQAHEDPEGLGQADLRNSTVTLPEGLVINPSGANGLDACSAAQIDLEGPGAAHCPDASKIGTVEVETPVVDHPLPGGVFVAMPHENPFDSLLAIYIAVDDPVTGVVVKLAGKVDPNPVTGRLTATFRDTPQVPFEDFKLDFSAGALAALRSPAVCGHWNTRSALGPWSAPESGPPVVASDPYDVIRAAAAGPCPTSAGALPVGVSFDAGTVTPAAGAYSPMVIRLRRPDGSQEFSALTLTPPPGLLARLAGIPYCPDAALAAAAGKSGREEESSPSCPAASRVGTVTVATGAGPRPYYTGGTAYLAGPYKGAPLSLAIVTPATAGPYDLGTVVVRTALHVDPRTAQITAESDPIPHILKGIPLDVRSIVVRLDHPGWGLNPTSCEPSSFGGRFTGVPGGAARLSSRFQVGGCDKLRFRPRLKLRLKGATGRSGHPSLRAVVTYPKKGRYANIARAQVGLPHSEFLDQGNLNKVCRQADLKAGTCPKSSIYGWAKAWTPLLSKPLQGPVYLGVGFGYKLPALVADLNGQIRILLVGRVDTTRRNGIRNTFEVVPDAPVSRFELRMKGGKKYGLLENSENICRHKQRASALFNAQNGLRLHLRPRIGNSCGKVKKKSRARKGHKAKRRKGVSRKR